MKPKIGITMGDPAGVGPEITVKMLAKEDVNSICVPIVIGSKSILEDAFRIVGSNSFQINSIKDMSQCSTDKSVINLIDLNNIRPSDYQYGQINARAGKAAGEFIEKGIKLAVEGNIDAIVTNPIHKESFKMGGYGEKYAGHTEMLADMTSSKDYTMMLACGNLRVVHVSTHVSMGQAVKLVKKERILKVIKIASNACLAMGIKDPRVAVAGLNPHCGDGGLFGDEEIMEVIPAIKEAVSQGMNVFGPIPADTAYAKAYGGAFDIVVAMYHDQGHIPVKTVGFHWDNDANSWGVMRGVNITLGLPIIRASVDHGTAFGKAGKGLADHTSLFDALKYAVMMANGKK